MQTSDCCNTQPFGGKFKKKSLSRLGPAGHKERHFHTAAGDVTAAWTNCQEDAIER